MNNLTSSSLPSSEKLELLELLKEKERRIQLNPLKYSKQHSKQKEASQALQRIRALFWGNRVGKTEWGAQEVVRYATGEHPYKTIIPPVSIWCACPSYELQEETTQKKLERYIPADAIYEPQKLRGNIWKSIKFKNGTEITFKSYEQGREKFQGVGKNLIWFDEEPPYDIWDECSVREEAGETLDIILTMTPVKGMTWVYDKIYSATGNRDIYVSEASWDDNPWLTEDQKNKMSNNRTKESLEVRNKGKFVKRVGMVCPWFSRSVHIKHYDVLNPSWTWFEVLDGGFSDPLAYLLIGADGDDTIHVVKGFREPQLQTEDIAKRRNTLVSGITINTGYSDNDNPRLVEELKDKHITLTPVVKMENEGSGWDETLAEKLSEYGSIQKGTGLPRLYISDSLVRESEETGELINWMQQEIENLSWLEVNKQEGSEIRPKWNDHRRFKHHFDGLRALAYFLIMYKRPNKDGLFSEYKNKSQMPINTDPIWM